MAVPSLASYDGSAGVLVDTNIWVDCIDSESAWHNWAVEQLQACSEKSPLHINLIIYTELLVPEPDVHALDALLDVYTLSAVRSLGRAERWRRKPLACTGAGAERVCCPCRTSSSARTRQWRI